MKKSTPLQSLGFDEKTEKVYRALLKLADSTAFQIAKEAGIKRTSAYHILENLIGMGLVSTYVSRGVKRYFAENPQKIKSFFEQKMILAERLIPELAKEINKSKSDLKIRIFEGKEALKTISEEALEAKEKTILSIGSSQKLIEFLGGKYGYGKRRREKSIFARSIRIEGDEPSTNPKLHQVKFLPKDFEFPGYIIIFDNNVGIILFDGNGFGFIVRNLSFSKMMKLFFETLWLIGK